MQSAIWVGVLSLLALPQAVVALVVVDDRPLIQVGADAEIWIDPSRSASIESVTGSASPRFTAADGAVPNLGIPRGDVWVRMHIRSSQPVAVERFLRLPLHAERITLYWPRGNGTWQALLAGDGVPPGRADYPGGTPTFRLEIPAAFDDTVLLRVESRGTVALPMTLLSPIAFAWTEHREQLVYGVYFGILLAMLVYHLFIGLTTRSISYRYYVGFLVSFGLYQAAVNGYGYEWIGARIGPLPHSPADLVPMFNGLALWSGLMFTRRFLGLRAVPWFDRIVGACAWAGLAVAAFALLRPHSAIVAVYALAVPSAALGMAAGIAAVARGYQPARWYLAAWSAPLLGVVVVVLKDVGVLPQHPVSESMLLVGSAAEMLLLSLALADRFRLIRRQRRQAQQELAETRARALAENERLARAFFRFVPERFLRLLGRDSIGDIQPGDATHREFTVMFTDIRGFTTLAEDWGSEATFRFLNGYVGRMSPIIHQYQGIIDKFIGDAILALFDNPDDALRAAIEMRAELQSYNQHRAVWAKVPIQVGIGLNHGELMLGTLGTGERIDTTVIGTTVNLAERLEALTKVFRVGLVVSDAVVGALRDRTAFHLREVDYARVKGMSEPVLVWEVFDADPAYLRERKAQSADYLRAGLHFYRQGRFDKALGLYAEAQRIFPEDSVCETHIRRCRRLIAFPPGDAWDGAWTGE